MAYLRLGYIREAKGSNKSVGLNLALLYIFNPDKTNNNEYVGGYNMHVTKDNCRHSAYQQMTETKQFFEKIDGRQGYHYKLSFPESDNITPELALQITNELCEECFSNYECAYSVHTNTDHIHSHIVFNSVGLDGYKYHYDKGDWSALIQPVANELCKKYGLQTLDLDIDPEQRRPCKTYNKWAEEKGYKAESVYSNAKIKEDIDSCISIAGSYEEFIQLMMAKGHVYDDSHKYITVKAPGRTRATRIINLSPDKFTYTKENIVNMINGIYLDRQDVINRLFADWNKYNSTVKVRFMQKYDLDLLRLSEEVELLADNNIDSKHSLREYATYISAADRELNIIRKRIINSLARHKAAYDAYDVIVANYIGYMQYKKGDYSRKKEYDLCIRAFEDLQIYDIGKLMKYSQDANRVLAQIDEYKKHIYVNKKIVNRIQDKIR